MDKDRKQSREQALACFLLYPQIPAIQRRPPPHALQEIEQAEQDRNAAIVMAHATGAYSYQQIARYFGVHFTTAGRIVRGGS